VFQYQTRRYFELILGVYFLLLGCVTPMICLPKSGHPTAPHFILELIFLCLATLFMVRGVQSVTVVVIAPPKPSQALL
jgi:hypothetical protein